MPVLESESVTPGIKCVRDPPRSIEPSSASSETVAMRFHIVVYLCPTMRAVLSCAEAVLGARLEQLGIALYVRQAWHHRAQHHQNYEPCHPNPPACASAPSMTIPHPHCVWLGRSPCTKPCARQHCRLWPPCTLLSMRYTHPALSSACLTSPCILPVSFTPAGGCPWLYRLADSDAATCSGEGRSGPPRGAGRDLWPAATPRGRGHWRHGPGPGVWPHEGWM